MSSSDEEEVSDIDQDDPVSAVWLVRCVVCRVSPQRTAAGADLRLVFRRALAAAARGPAMDQRPSR